MSVENDVNRSIEKNSPDVLNFLRVAATMFVFLLHGRSYVEDVDGGYWLFAMITNFPAWAGVWILFFPAICFARDLLKTDIRYMRREG